MFLRWCCLCVCCWTGWLQTGTVQETCMVMNQILTVHKCTQYGSIRTVMWWSSLYIFGIAFTDQATPKKAHNPRYVPWIQCILVYCIHVQCSIRVAITAAGLSRILQALTFWTRVRTILCDRHGQCVEMGAGVAKVNAIKKNTLLFNSIIWVEQKELGTILCFFGVGLTI